MPFCERLLWRSKILNALWVGTGDATSERHAQLKLPFQDLSDKQIWDAAWGDEDVDSIPDTPQQTKQDPLQLPEERELERLEDAHKVKHKYCSLQACQDRTTY